MTRSHYYSYGHSKGLCLEKKKLSEDIIICDKRDKENIEDTHATNFGNSSDVSEESTYEGLLGRLIFV